MQQLMAQPVMQPNPIAQPAPTTDLFGGGDLFAPSQPPAAQFTPQTSYYNAYEDSVLKIEFSFKRTNQNEHNITALFSNKQMANVSGVSLQIAVQKYMRLTLQGISSGEIAGGSS